MLSTQSKSLTLSYNDFTPSQTAAIDALYEGNRLLVAGVGFGKCAVGQTAAQELLDDMELKRVLVVAPLKVCQLTWANEHVKWEHLTRPAMALGDAGQRSQAIEGPARVVVINIENLPWLFEKYGHGHGFDGLLIDEISKFKAAGSKGVKTLRRHLDDFSWRCGMSATPVAEAGIDIYAQALLIDGGVALGRNKDRFLRRYFYPTDFQQRKWALLPGSAAELSAALSALVYVAEDTAYAASLPELRDQVINVDMPVGGWRAYDDMVTEMYIDFVDRAVEAPNQAVVTGKLTQVTAGAVYDADKTAHWLHFAKFDCLDALLQAADGPVMVAYAYQFELAHLRTRYPGLRVLADDPEGCERDWNAGEIELLAVHPKSAGHGLNLQHGGHELIVLTPPWSADAWAQLVGRLRRRGQRSPFVRRTVLAVPGTVDELILDRHLTKKGDERSLMAHLRAVARK